MGIDWDAYHQSLSTLPSWNPLPPGPDDPPLPPAHCWDNGETPGNENCTNTIDGINYLSMPSRNQSQCGLCWLYAIVHTLELQYAIELNIPAMELSIQHAISCTATGCKSNSKCFDGHRPMFMMGALGTFGFIGFLPEYGFVLEEDYPTAENALDMDFSWNCPNCNEFKNDPSVEYYRPADKSYVGEYGQQTDEQTMMMALLQGPVYSGFRTTGGFFVECRDPEQDRIGHAVSVVGYKNHGRTLVIKNSWGEDYLQEMDWDEWKPCGLTTSAFRYTELSDPEPFVGE